MDHIEVCLTSDSNGQSFNTSIWDPYSGTSIASFKGGNSSSRTLSIIGDSYIISALQNKPLISVWSLGRKDQTQQTMVTPRPVKALAISPDGLYCVAGVDDMLHVWEVPSGRLMTVVQKHFQQITCIRFTDDGSTVITGGDDNIILVWSLAELLSVDQLTGIEPLYTWSVHSLPITDIHCGVGGNKARVVSASLDQTCRLWDLSSGHLICTFIFDTAITAVTMDCAQLRIYAGAMDGTISEIQLFKGVDSTTQHVSKNTDETNTHFTGHSGRVTCLSVSIDGCLLISGSVDGTCRIFDTSSRQSLKILPHKGPITNALFTVCPAAMFSPDFKPNFTVKNFKRQIGQIDDNAGFDENSAQDCGIVTVPAITHVKSRDKFEEILTLTERCCGENVGLMNSLSTTVLARMDELEVEIENVKKRSAMILISTCSDVIEETTINTASPRNSRKRKQNQLNTTTCNNNKN